MKNVEQQTLFKGWSKGVSESLGWSRQVTAEVFATREYKQAKEEAEAHRISMAAIQADEDTHSAASSSWEGCGKSQAKGKSKDKNGKQGPPDAKQSDAQAKGKDKKGKDTKGKGQGKKGKVGDEPLVPAIAKQSDKGKDKGKVGGEQSVPAFSKQSLAKGKGDDSSKDKKGQVGGGPSAPAQAKGNVPFKEFKGQVGGDRSDAEATKGKDKGTKGQVGGDQSAPAFAKQSDAEVKGKGPGKDIKGQVGGHQANAKQSDAEESDNK